MILPDLALPAELDWLGDPATWKPLPQQETWDDLCSFWEADPSRIQFPPLVWESCGEGCARADVHQGHAERVAIAAMSHSAAEGASGPYLHVGQGEFDAGVFGVQFQRVIDLQSGRTVGAVEQLRQRLEGTSWCGASVTLGSGLEVESYRSTPDDDGPLFIKGGLDPRDGSWTWQLPWATKNDRGFDHGWCRWATMEAGARSFYFCGFVVRAATTPGSSELEVLARPGDDGFSAGRGAALGDLVVWPELSRSDVGARIRGWSPDGRGVRTLLDDIRIDACAVGMSDTHVAGFASANACDSHQLEGRLWFSERKEDGTLGEVEVGPIFWPERVVAYPIKVWGDHIAAVWGERSYVELADRRRLVLARMSDWAMRDLRGIPGYEIGEAELTDEHLYVVYNEPGSRRFSHVYRYDLDKFELLGQPLEPVSEPAAPEPARR